MRTVHSVIKRTPRKYLAEIVMIDDFSNKGGSAFLTYKGFGKKLYNVASVHKNKLCKMVGRAKIL